MTDTMTNATNATSPGPTSRPSTVITSPDGAPALIYDALILAGGRGSRMAGRDKGWVMWNGHPLIEHVLERLSRQTVMPERTMISANRNLDAYKQTGHKVVTDERADFFGPLAGVEAGLMRCKKNWLLVVPCDTPLLPADLFTQLHAAITEQTGTLAAYAVSPDGPQPLCCLLHPSISGSLSRFLDAGHGSVVDWLEQAGAVPVAFPDSVAFSNFNSMDMFQTLRSPA